MNVELRQIGGVEVAVAELKACQWNFPPPSSLLDPSDVHSYRLGSGREDDPYPHRFEAIWQERYIANGTSEVVGSIAIYMPGAATIFGPEGLRAVLPGDWLFSKGEVMAGNPSSKGMTCAEAEEIVASLAQKIIDYAVGLRRTA